MKPKLYECPICLGDDFENIYSRGIYYDKYFIAICVKCGLVCQNPRMNEKFFEKYYAGTAYYGNYQPRVLNRTNLKSSSSTRAGFIFNNAKHYIKKTSRILEIG